MVLLGNNLKSKDNILYAVVIFLIQQLKYTISEDNQLQNPSLCSSEGMEIGMTKTEIIKQSDQDKYCKLINNIKQTGGI